MNCQSQEPPWQQLPSNSKLRKVQINLMENPTPKNKNKKLMEKRTEQARDLCL